MDKTPHLSGTMVLHHVLEHSMTNFHYRLMPLLPDIDNLCPLILTHSYNSQSIPRQGLQSINEKW